MIVHAERRGPVSLQTGPGARVHGPAEGFHSAADEGVMKAATGIGIAVAVVGILMGAMMDGTSPAAFMNPTALILIIAGTAGVTMASVGMDGMKKIPSLYKLVISAEPLDVQGRVNLLVSLAEQARREGLLALDAQIADIDDDFTKKGLQLVVDGTDPGTRPRHPRGRDRRDGGSPPRRRTALREGGVASRRRSGSSARSWAWCTCSRTCPRRRRSVPRSLRRSSPR